MGTLPMVLISGNHYGTLFIGGSREADLLASVTQLEVDKDSNLRAILQLFTSGPSA